MRKYLVECYETILLSQEVEVEGPAREDEALFKKLIDRAQKAGNWSEESMGTGGNRVSRVEDDPKHPWIPVAVQVYEEKEDA